MKNLKKFGIVASAYLLPLAAFAANDAAGQDLNNIQDFFNRINSIINLTIPFLVGIAVLIIIWGIFNYIAGAGDEEKRASAKQFVIWGVIGIFIMLSIWGLVSILVNTFDFKRTPLTSDQLPQFGSQDATE